MNIVNDSQITGAAAKWLRERAGLGQRPFWGAWGIAQSSGWRYETGAAPIPKALRTLIFARHVAGLNLDTGSDAGAAEVVRIGQLAAAGEHVRQARRLLSEIEN